MRIIVVLTALLFSWSVYAAETDTINIINVPDGVNQFTYLTADTLFFAIKDKDNRSDAGDYFGRIRFTPSPGVDTIKWTFDWSYEGVPQSVSSSDTIRLIVDIPGEGVYTFRAEAEVEVDTVRTETLIVEKRFIVFYDYLDFELDLSDEMNCEFVTIDIDTLYIPRYGSFAGQKNVLYTVTKSGQGSPGEISSPDYRDFVPLSVEGVDKDLMVKVKIKDKFDFEWEREIEYISYIPSVDMKIELEKALGENTGEAPLTVNFSDNGNNAHSWEWFLYKDTLDLQQPLTFVEDSLLEERIRYERNFTYTYEHPGYYAVKLVVTNTNGINHCSDTSEMEYIKVIPSLVDVPNVFTPNGDGINDVFKVKAESLEYFHGMILNRWDRVIYEWRDPSGGWDGKIHGKDAAPGTYYYIIKAKGRELHSPPRYVKKGAFLLVR